MKLSMKTDYTLRALIDLALHYGQGPIQSADIAGRHAIPEPYLDQLLTTLRKAGVIRSMRGPQGGHLLAKPPTRISLAEVILVLEGSLAPASCLERQDGCPQSTACAIREVWQEWQDASLRLLAGKTIADLAERHSQFERTLMYHI